MQRLELGKTIGTGERDGEKLQSVPVPLPTRGHAGRTCPLGRNNRCQTDDRLPVLGDDHFLSGKCLGDQPRKLSLGLVHIHLHSRHSD